MSSIVLCALVGAVALGFMVLAGVRNASGCYRFQPRADITTLELAQVVGHASALDKPIAFRAGQFETLGPLQRHFVPASCF